MKNLVNKVSSSRLGDVRVLSGGLHSLIVSYPGRIGYWRVGIPPSGPMDDFSFRIGNKLVANITSRQSQVAGMEITYKGPKLQFEQDTTIALTGAKIKHANINGELDLSDRWNTPIAIRSGDVVDLTDTNICTEAAGCRTYLCVANGGFVMDDYLGSKTSFPMGKIGGARNDAVLQQGDVLQYVPCSTPIATDSAELTVSNGLVSDMYIQNQWEIGVLAGPQSSPDYLTQEDVDLLYAAEYEVTHNASRLGIRLNALNATKFRWARSDGGEGGSHPSNLIDNPYPIGSVNFTGDYPVILTVDGPSLGGFVCPITIPSTELWKVGQLKPGDRVKFKLMSLQSVITEKQKTETFIEDRTENNVDEEQQSKIEYAEFEKERLEPVLQQISANKNGLQPKVQYRLGGDRYLLIDYGEDEIDLNLRVRVHKLEEHLLREAKAKGLDGIIDTIPGVKTLLIEFDPLQCSLRYLLNLCVDIEQNYLCDAMDLSRNEIVLPSRKFHLPFVFNCEWTNAAIQRYMNEVRDKAAYLPSNTQFICNNNGLEGGVDELERLVYDISFLVLGLGDVYLGAPCAIPIDPRHRLNVPKYNPSRNFTPEGAVGIGGKFMCIYPMESPGGYQLIGRTLQIFDKLDKNQKPWLLNMFDQVQFYPVSRDELVKQREDNAAGKLSFNMQEEEFNLNEYNRKYMEDQAIQQEVKQMKENQKRCQAQQLKYDKQLLEQDSIALNEIVCQNILWYQAQMIINGAKYGTSLYLHVTREYEENVVDIKQENFIRPLHQIESQSFTLNVYGKPYTVKLKGISKKATDLYDVTFVVNNAHEWTVTDIEFDEENKNYVALETDHGLLDGDEANDIVLEEGIDDKNVEMIFNALPGKVVNLHVDIGDKVAKGDIVATISAMKMETPIHSHVEGTVVYINREEILPAKTVVAHVSR